MGYTWIRAQIVVEVYENITFDHLIPIPFNCCNHRHERMHLPKLESIKSREFNTDDLNKVEHIGNQYLDQLNKVIINEPLMDQHYTLIIAFRAI